MGMLLSHGKKGGGLVELDISAKGILQKGSRGGSCVFGVFSTCPDDVRWHLELCSPPDKTILVPPTHILVWTWKPRVKSFDHEKQSLRVKSAPPRAHSTVYCAFAERFTAQAPGRAVVCVRASEERFLLSKSTTLSLRDWQ